MRLLVLAWFGLEYMCAIYGWGQVLLVAPGEALVSVSEDNATSPDSLSAGYSKVVDRLSSR